MSKAHSNKGRLFEFGDKDTMMRFIFLYKDLFTPYSKDVINYESFVCDDNSSVHLNKNGNLTHCKGHHDARRINMLSNGYKILNDKLIRVNLTPENLETILKSGCFRERMENRRKFYVFEELA